MISKVLLQTAKHVDILSIDRSFTNPCFADSSIRAFLHKDPIMTKSSVLKFTSKNSRARMPSVDIDPDKQNVVMTSANLPLINNQGNNVWGNRVKDHRVELLSVFQSKVMRSNFPKKGLECVTHLSQILEKNGRLVHSYRSDVGPAFSGLLPRPGEVSCSQVLIVLDDLYQYAMELLTSDGYVSQQTIDELELLSSLSEVQQENISMQQLSASISSLAKAHAGALTKNHREASVLLNFVSQSLRALTPARLKSPYNACVLCHRHGLDRVICLHHVEDNKYIASTTQRARYNQALEVGEKRIEASVRNHREEFRKILEIEANQALVPENALTAFNLIFSAPIHNGCVDLPSLWSSAVDAGSGDGFFSLSLTAQTWYSSEPVGDMDGIKRLDQPLGSLLLHILEDISRFDCYVSMGGELPRRRRERSHPHETSPQ